MNKDIELTIVSNIMMADGIGKQGIGLCSIIDNKLQTNVCQLPPCSYKDISPELLKMFIKPFNGFGKITFHTSILGVNNQIIPFHQSIDSKLKISYSMFESDQIPDLWVYILNKYYDMVVVPDQFLVSVYKNSGVKIPIFVIPLGILVEELLKIPFKEKAGTPFTFGMSGGFYKRKNHIKLIQAFDKEFGNNPNFKLKLHGRFGPYKSEIDKAIKSINLNNIEYLTAPLSNNDYNKFMEEIDCYVFPSMGEGFSITPRESIALGKPCIVSNNTSQRTICDSGYVIPLEANKKIPALYEVFGNKSIGNFYDCNSENLAKLMRNVYENYNIHLKQAQSGREWVKQYLWTELKPIYLNLFNPQDIRLHTSNLIDKNVFQTNDKILFKKMKDLFNV